MLSNPTHEATGAESGAGADDLGGGFPSYGRVLPRGRAHLVLECEGRDQDRYPSGIRTASLQRRGDRPPHGASGSWRLRGGRWGDCSAHQPTEAHDQGATTTEAVATGRAQTGRIVTTATALLAITFLAFGTAQISFLQLFGVGTGVAILVDATIIRGLLVPAFMRLAGDLNWTAPRLLQRLHQRMEGQAG